jgi:hypothetical protein
MMKILVTEDVEVLVCRVVSGLGAAMIMLMTIEWISQGHRIWLHPPGW